MRELEELREAIERVCALDPTALPAAEAAEVALEVGRLVDRLTGARWGALAAVESSGYWALDGSRSMEAWLSSQSGTSFGSARSDVATARALSAELPLAAEAVKAGDVGAEHVRTLARSAPTSDLRRERLDDPEHGEAFLLAHAGEVDAGRFKRVVDRWAVRTDPEAAEAARQRSHRNRCLTVADRDGGTEVAGSLTHDDGEIVRTALRAMIGTPAADDTRTGAQRMADALVAICRLVLDSGQLGTGAAVRPHLLVTVDLPTLLAKEGEAVEPALLTQSGQPIPRSALQRICCDAEVTRVVFGAPGVVLDLGRRQRTLPEPQRKAVIARDGTCRYPGCHAPPRLCEVHHLVPWSEGGETSVANSVLLCWHHHDVLHMKQQSLSWDADVALWILRDALGRAIGRRAAGYLESGLFVA